MLYIDRTSGQIRLARTASTVTCYGLYGEPDRTKFLLKSEKNPCGRCGQRCRAPGQPTVFTVTSP